MSPSASSRRRPVAAKSRSLGADTSYRTVTMLEESHDLPLVDFSINLRTGSVEDPDGAEGLTRTMARMLRMGTGKLRGGAVEERIAGLGGRLSIETSTSYMRLHATVIRRNLEPLVALLAELLLHPAFRRNDLAQVKRENLADLVAIRDDDRSLAVRGFRRLLFGDHPYGRSALGSRESIAAIERQQLIDHHAALLVSGNLIIAAAGAIDAEELASLTERHFRAVPTGKAARRALKPAHLQRGRRILIIDKPQRSQAQLLIGTLGLQVGDPDSFPLEVANTAFGGTFTSRLMREVRSKRGWSYGASSRLDEDRVRDAWSMYTFPAVKDVVACAALQLELLDAWVTDGVSAHELRFAKSYLSKSHCFDIDTAPKRLDHRVDLQLFDQPVEHYTKFSEHIRAVTITAANAAIKKHIDPRRLAIVVVATAKEVEAQLRALPGVNELQVVPYDRDF